MRRRRRVLTDTQRSELAAKKAAQVTGECQICEGTFCTKKGLIVLHGYKRPGTGYIHGHCFGMNHVPYAKGTDALVVYLERLKASVVSNEKALARWTSRRVPSITELEVHSGYTNTLVEFAVGVTDLYMWERKYARHLAEAENTLQWFSMEVARVERRIANWKPT